MKQRFMMNDKDNIAVNEGMNMEKTGFHTTSSILFSKCKLRRQQTHEKELFDIWKFSLS